MVQENNSLGIFRVKYLVTLFFLIGVHVSESDKAVSISKQVKMVQEGKHLAFIILEYYNDKSYSQILLKVIRQ